MNLQPNGVYILVDSNRKRTNIQIKYVVWEVVIGTIGENKVK